MEEIKTSDEEAEGLGILDDPVAIDANMVHQFRKSLGGPYEEGIVISQVRHGDCHGIFAMGRTRR